MTLLGRSHHHCSRNSTSGEIAELFRLSTLVAEKAVNPFRIRIENFGLLLRFLQRSIRSTSEITICSQKTLPALDFIKISIRFLLIGSGTVSETLRHGRMQLGSDVAKNFLFLVPVKLRPNKTENKTVLATVLFGFLFQLSSDRHSSHTWIGVVAVSRRQ